jgi:hypothetical protein
MSNSETNSVVARSEGSLADFPSLKDFIYQPMTDWHGLFQDWFSPRITFGANIADKPVETEVLNTVGSYGSQINRIMDAMSVLISRLDRHELTPKEQVAIYRFTELAALADKVATSFGGKPGPGDVTLTEVVRWLDAIKDLKRSDPQAYDHVAGLVKDLAKDP